MFYVSCAIVDSSNLDKTSHLNVLGIRITCPCDLYPLTPKFYIVKLGCTGVYIIFLFLLQNIDCGYSLEPPHVSTLIAKKWERSLPNHKCHEAIF